MFTRIITAFAIAHSVVFAGAAACAASPVAFHALPPPEASANILPIELFPHKWQYVGPRSLHRHGPFNYYFGGWWYPRPWWYGPGVAFHSGDRDRYSGYWDDFDWGEGGYTEGTDEHVEWCIDHHRAYSQETDSFIGHDGAWHPCKTPFD